MKKNLKERREQRLREQKILSSMFPSKPRSEWDHVQRRIQTLDFDTPRYLNPLERALRNAQQERAFRQEERRQRERSPSPSMIRALEKHSQQQRLAQLAEEIPLQEYMYDRLRRMKSPVQRDPEYDPYNIYPYPVQQSPRTRSPRKRSPSELVRLLNDRHNPERPKKRSRQLNIV